MIEAKIIFTLNNVETTIQCSKDDKMDDICRRYSMEINKNNNNLIFLYEGKKINSDLNFNQQANMIDKNNNEMKISVYEKENHLICHKCGEKLKFNKEDINNIILCNKIINDNIDEIKLQLNNVIENSSVDSNKIILNNINKMLNSINEYTLKNNETLINLLKNNNDLINNNISLDNNNCDNENILKNALLTQLNEINGKEDLSNINNNKENCLNLNKNKLYEKIKSKFINKIIFSNVNERIKLKIIKYNKKLQKKLDINIINYKHFLGKYIVYETKNKGKEYDFGDNLIYSGEYLNGERHGKGKEYIKGNILNFEGEYINGKRSGYGKDYYDNGNLYYEGEYSNDEQNGFGKEYYLDGELKFEGEFKNNNKWNGNIYDKNNNLVSEIRNGRGLLKEYTNDGKLIFEGEYLNGKINGSGKEYYINGKLKFTGEFKDGKRWNGKGYDLSNNIIYELKNGEGTIEEYDSDGYLVFECKYKNGEKDGNGKEYDNGKLIFEGDYKNGKRNGKGKEYHYNDGSIFEGVYLNGERNGKGKEYYYNILIFEGEYLNGERNGKAKEYYKNGELRFDGYYLYSYKIKGKEYLEGKLEYEGKYLYGDKWEGKGYDKNGNIIYELNNGNGKVKEYNWKGRLIFKGEYKNGKKNGKGKDYEDDKCIFYGEYLNGYRWEGIGLKIDEQYCGDENIIYEYEYLDGKVHTRYKL